MREVFQQELREVQNRLVEIATLVETAIDLATRAFSESNVSLAERERPAARPASGTGAVQLTLFQAVESAALQRLKAMDLDQLAPRQALDLLYELQAAAKRE